MPDSPSGRMDKNADRFLRGRSHPVFMIVAFVSVFFFAGLPFLFDTDSWLLVVPCLIGCFSCFFLFIRLLVGLEGELANLKFIFLIIAGYLCYRAGEQWYLIVLLTAGTLLCSFLIARLIGPSVPVIRQRANSPRSAWRLSDSSLSGANITCATRLANCRALSRESLSHSGSAPAAATSIWRKMRLKHAKSWP